VIKGKGFILFLLQISYGLHQ